MRFRKKLNLRRSKVRETILTGRVSQITRFLTLKRVNIFLLYLLFVILCIAILSFELIQRGSYLDILPLGIIVIELSIGAAFYIYHYQRRILQRPVRVSALIGLFVLLLFGAKVGVLFSHHTSWVLGSSVIAAIILTISYNQRLALGLGLFYVMLSSLTTLPAVDVNLFFTMTAAVATCCFSLREVRSRMKLLEVGALTTAVVLVTTMALSFLSGEVKGVQIFTDAGYNATAAFLAALLLQSLLPVIERVFGIATSMTLLDYSDASQPLLKRLAMEAPGTFSHSLLVGSIAESAAESIGCNGLLCRVGSYYHDIGKINKPHYFTENELGSHSRHEELSPAMSQLIIIGHVKDGIEMAKEYGLPAVLRQFIETHHGKTLVEYFYREAKKQQDSKNGRGGSLSESEFRYEGPKPGTKEAAIVMLSDSVEGALRSMPELTPKKIETLVHNMAMKRLQDGQFDECELTLRELSQIESSVSKSLVGHYHGRIAYPSDVMEAGQEGAQSAEKVDNGGQEETQVSQKGPKKS